MSSEKLVPVIVDAGEIKAHDVDVINVSRLLRCLDISLSRVSIRPVRPKRWTNNVQRKVKAAGKGYSMEENERGMGAC
ncbi:MAG: hypothetical protein IPI17_10480 [Nitrosomonas sp.]|nr:hypothetical protein [Nitrosomonas sp.]